MALALGIDALNAGAGNHAETGKLGVDHGIDPEAIATDLGERFGRLQVARQSVHLGRHRVFYQQPLQARLDRRPMQHVDAILLEQRIVQAL